MELNQNIIVEKLRDLGIPESEIETRLMRLKMSTSGHYDPLTDTYKDQVKNEPSEALNEPQNVKTARQLYSEQIDKLKLPECPQKARYYDWNIDREFHNWLKQINSDSGYVPNDDEKTFLEEIECVLILRNYSSSVELEKYNERDWIIRILEMRIDIRDSVLLPDYYSQIDDRLPIDIVSNDEAQRIFQDINPDGFKDWNLPLLPVRNYLDYASVPSGKGTEQSNGTPTPSITEPVDKAAEPSIVPKLKSQEELDKEFLEPFELDPTIEDEPIQYCFEVGGVSCIPKGDQQANKGQQKNGKTFAEVLFMGAALKGEYLGVRCLIPNAKVLFCDTEQHPRNTRLVYRRVCQIAGINGRERYERLSMLHLRLADDVEITKKAIRLKIMYFRPDIVFIDGIVDCIIDFNDPKESKQYITELSKLALEYNCAIMSTLHTNPNDENKMRGHLGTILAQKASDVIQCIKTKKDDGSVVFEVEQTENRNNADFKKFSFAIEMRKDVSGELISVPVKSYVSVQEKAALDELFRWALYNNPMRRADLKDKITSDDCPKKVSRSTAYQRINDALAAGIIKDDDPVTYRLRYVGLDMKNEDGMPF